MTLGHIDDALGYGCWSLFRAPRFDDHDSCDVTFTPLPGSLGGVVDRAVRRPGAPGAPSVGREADRVQ